LLSFSSWSAALVSMISPLPAVVWWEWRSCLFGCEVCLFWCLSSGGILWWLI
jgi:hypothetical protein